MIADPFQLYGIPISVDLASGVESLGTFALQDLSSKKTVRVCSSFAGTGLKATLTFAQTLSSSENAPVGSDRTLVRLDVEKYDSIAEKTFVGSVYFVAVLPKTSDWAFDAAKVKSMYAALGGLLVSKNSPSSSLHLQAPSDIVPRLLTGEP